MGIAPFHNQVDPGLVGQMLDIIMRGMRSKEHLVVANRDLDKPEWRKEVADELRTGTVFRIAPRVYGIRSPFRSNSEPPSGLSEKLTPMPHQVATALARQNGWRLAIPSDIAEYLLGLKEMPPQIARIPYDQKYSRLYAKAGLTLIPGAPGLFDLTPAGQVLAMGLPQEASAPGLREIGRLAAAGAMMENPLKHWLMADYENNRLGERERLVAEVLLTTGRIVERQAPTFFIPPDESTVSVEQWRIFCRRGREFLAAEAVMGHPDIADGRPLGISSALMWIDEKLGWARTRSRVYRLGKRKF